jgi:hypothetical protein
MTVQYFEQFVGDIHYPTLKIGDKVKLTGTALLDDENGFPGYEDIIGQIVHIAEEDRINPFTVNFARQPDGLDYGQFAFSRHELILVENA